MNIEKIKNKLIVLEGMDKSGKSTAARDLFNYLIDNGIENVLLTKQPGEMLLGDFSEITYSLTKTDYYEINNLSQMFSFLLDRSEHTEKVINEYLDDGYTVISDRWWYSTIAYQVFGHELNKQHPYTEDFFIAMNQMATHSREPDWAFFLDGQALSYKDENDIFENKENDFTERVKKGYEYLIEREYLQPIKIEIGNTDKTLERILKVLAKA